MLLICSALATFHYACVLYVLILCYSLSDLYWVVMLCMSYTPLVGLTVMICMALCVSYCCNLAVIRVSQWFVYVCYPCMSVLLVLRFATLVAAPVLLSC